MNEKKLTIYIARDLPDFDDGEFDNDGEIFCYLAKPNLSELGEYVTSGNDANIPDAFLGLPVESFPEIKNGECREAEIVLKGK